MSVGGNAPIFLLCTARPELLEEHPDWNAPGEYRGSLELERLALEDAGELASRLDLGVLSGDQRRRVVEGSNGNPLFLEQLIAYALETGTSSEAFALPPSLQALLAARLDRLGPGERVVLACASVVGRDFFLGAVAELLPADAGRSFRRHFDSLRLKGFVESGESSLPFEEALRFRHVLFQEAAYRSVSKERRARLHERLVPWLAERPRVGSDEVVGYHFEQSYLYRTELGVGEAETRTLALRAGERLSAAAESALVRNDLPAAVNLLNARDGSAGSGGRASPRSTCGTGRRVVPRWAGGEGARGSR